MSLREWCEKSVAATWRQPYFMYYGGSDRETDAFTFSRTRDSDVLDISNFDVIYRDLEERFPGDVWIERASHFLCGWVDNIVVRMLDQEGEPTGAAIAVNEWVGALADYPVADEHAYCEAKHDAKLDTLVWNSGCDLEEAGLVLDWMHANDTPGMEDSGDDFWPDQSDVDVALLELGLRMRCRGCEDVVEPDEVTERRGVCRFCTYGYRVKSWIRSTSLRLRGEFFLRRQNTWHERVRQARADRKALARIK